jgi:hypothetical protein
LGLLVFGAIMSVLTNDDVLVYGDRVLQAQRPYDALSVILNLSVVLLPALLGRKFLADNVGHLALMKAVCIAALAYVPLMLFEIRMSPQINQMVYGFFPHSWVQHVRGGGFRPLVFLDHGCIWASSWPSPASASRSWCGYRRRRRACATSWP